MNDLSWTSINFLIRLLRNTSFMFHSSPSISYLSQPECSSINKQTKRKRERKKRRTIPRSCFPALYQKQEGSRRREKSGGWLGSRSARFRIIVLLLLLLLPGQEHSIECRRSRAWRRNNLMGGIRLDLLRLIIPPRDWKTLAAWHGAHVSRASNLGVQRGCD